MDIGILNSISSRREALCAHYNLPEDAERKVAELFARIERFGQTCCDQADFEKQFLISELNQIYTNFFTEFAPYVKTPEGTITVEEQQQQAANELAESVVKSQAKRTVKSAFVQMLPRPLYDWYIYGIYNIPILGRILGAKNNIEQIKRLKKK
ncbi:hypothetical protein [Parabacteroides sp. PF5-9]|uniref:hypothetical protein n=1 Tax=Parabacteroides sp. PF5-9 TaxID=1742404 RepID=UPI00247493C4|nr:hypothetical protein [Parabacteroides sp. PF5-9]MDH6356999.1 hypothetical protein [Parabacteroides sp. PF5-9]